MEQYPQTEFLKKKLKERPGSGYILPDGSAMATLAGPELDDVIIITAPAGENFNDMTDEAVDDCVIVALIKDKEERS